MCAHTDTHYIFLSLLCLRHRGLTGGLGLATVGQISALVELVVKKSRVALGNRRGRQVRLLLPLPSVLLPPQCWSKECSLQNFLSSSIFIPKPVLPGASDDMLSCEIQRLEGQKLTPPHHSLAQGSSRAALFSHGLSKNATPWVFYIQ